MRRGCLLLVLAVAACKGPTTPARAPRATVVPPAPLVVGQAVQLTGKVKLRLDPTGLISDLGGGIISDHAAGVISNNSGALISDGGGGIISDHASGLTSKVKRQLLDAPVPAVFLLADARIGFYDAAGKPLLDEAGRPIATTSDKEGNYKLAARLPKQNLVLRIQLWNGGELSALLPAGAGEQAISTATSLGASYVLDRYVKGSQEVLDRLPESEAVRLERELDAAEQRLESVPEYRPEALSSFVDALRGREPAVDKSLSDVAAILLGQQSIGSGRPAVQVALGSPRAVLALPGGDFMIGEGFFGRIRKVTTSGTIETFADKAYGVLPRNFSGLRDLIRGPDGTLYVAMEAAGQVYRIRPDNTVELVAGTGEAKRGAPGGLATATPIVARSLALAPDGTLLIGEGEGHDEDELVPGRLLSVGADGILNLLDEGKERDLGGIASLSWAPDGSLYMLVGAVDKRRQGQVFRRAADGKLTRVRGNLETSERGDMAIAPDGSLYVSENRARRVSKYAPDGTATIVAGAGAPAGATALLEPGALSLAPDGTLLIADLGSGLIQALGSGGLQTLAGIREFRSSDDASAIPLSAPGGVVFDGAGRLVMAETGGNAIKRLENGSLELIAGAARGSDGDGGPAVEALLELPTGLIYREGTLYIHDNGNKRIRAIAPDGTITTVAGGGKGDPLPGKPLAAPGASIRGGMGFAVGPDGLLYWTEVNHRQVMRLTRDNLVEVVVGKGGKVDALELQDEVGDGGPALEASLSFPLGLAFGPDGALYIADAGHFRIRKVEGLAQGQATISTFAGLPPLKTFERLDGNAPPDDTGRDAARASLLLPGALVFDKAGNLFVGELGTTNLSLLGPMCGQDVANLEVASVPARVRKIAPDRAISTVAGPGGKFFADPAALDKLVLPTGLGLDPSGRLVIVDGGANLIRILPAAGIP